MNAIRKEFSSESARKKRLGQYFTGLQLAKLLAALSQVEQAKSILDPMAGNGDILAACYEIGAKPETVGAIEIDPIALKDCALRVNSVVPLLGNAFDISILLKLPTLQWDMVITNPPYVRYQSMTKGVDASLKLPNAKEVRKSLITTIKHIPNLDIQDQQLFHHLCAQYSGLSDLAVPSWILCAALVKQGGMLAVVVPDSWLNREYALPIQYMLLRWFRIRYIVEDVNAAWFDDALVKTNLLVAERISRRDSAFDWADDGFVHIRLSKDASTDSSIVGNLYPGSNDSEIKFAQEARRWLDKRINTASSEVSSHWTALSHMSKNLQRACSSLAWFRLMDEYVAQTAASKIQLPPELAKWLGKKTATTTFINFEDMGVQVGQGLRTGANRFFYADCTEVVNGAATIAPSPIFGIKHVTVPDSCVATVLRKQSELPDGFILQPSMLKGRVLTLQNHALPEDLERCHNKFPLSYNEITSELAYLIRVASQTNFGTEDDPKHVYELAAVAPNIRANQKNQLPRFWYMLPDFAPRHTPDLFIARVNNGHPKTFLNDERTAIIDANFSTIWLGNKSKINAHSLLAFLNSSWSIVSLELISSVLGGGALKVEAAHLRKIPIPELTSADWMQLSTLGKKLAGSATKDVGRIIDAIDKIIVSSLTGTQNPEKNIAQLRHIAQTHLERRTGK